MQFGTNVLGVIEANLPPIFTSLTHRTHRALLPYQIAPSRPHGDRKKGSSRNCTRCQLELHNSPLRRAGGRQVVHSGPRRRRARDCQEARRDPIIQPEQTCEGILSSRSSPDAGFFFAGKYPLF